MMNTNRDKNYAKYHLEMYLKLFSKTLINCDAKNYLEKNGILISNLVF